MEKKGKVIMIKIENTEVVGWEHAIRGMRNPMNSWDKSDSGVVFEDGEYEGIEYHNAYYRIGVNDLHLMAKLRNAGTDHRKYMRMITVYLDITAPLYWWKEFDTYKVGTVANSCSTMHKIHSKPIEISDFSIDDFEFKLDETLEFATDAIAHLLSALEYLRQEFLETKDKRYWRLLIQLLPESYNQKRTIMLNYEVLANMYKSRKNHKLDEWREFCKWIEILPHSELITGEFENENN